MDLAPPCIVVVGSCNTDLISYMNSFPAPGETVIGDKFESGFGGKGANQCVMAAKLSAGGGPLVAMIGAVGDDTFGAATLGNFDEVGVHRVGVAIHAGMASGVAPIFVDKSGQNCIVVVPGANDAITPLHVTNALSCAALSRVGAVLCQLEIPTEATLAALRHARTVNALSVFTPAPAPRQQLHPDFYSLTDVLVPNEGEARALAGNAELGCIAAARVLLARGVGAVVVTLGSRGSLVVLDAAVLYHVPAAHVASVVDTTGAGDAFAGSLAFFYSLLANAAGSGSGDRRLDRPALLEACRRAAFVAADSVSKRGTQKSYAVRGDLPAALFSGSIGFGGACPGLPVPRLLPADAADV